MKTQPLKRASNGVMRSRTIWLIGVAILLPLVSVFALFWSIFGPAIKYSWDHPSREVNNSKDIDDLPDHVERVASSTIGDADLALLANRVSVKMLDLSENPNFTDAGLAHIARIRGLEELTLIRTKVTDKGMKHLRNSQLTYLGLWHTGITDQSLFYIAGMHSLKQLHLKDCDRISDVGLAKLRKLENLWMLNLSECNGITDAGLIFLADCPRLGFLLIRNCPGVTAAGVEEFRRINPECDVGS
jgi:Leucine Rich repeat